MEIYDNNFENMRLTMLAQQYPEIATSICKFTFNAEEDKDEFSHGTWLCDDKTHQKLLHSSFKMQLISLINNFIEYRSICDQLPKKEGIVHFGDGNLKIEWLKDGGLASLKANESKIQP